MQAPSVTLRRHIFLYVDTLVKKSNDCIIFERSFVLEETALTITVLRFIAVVFRSKTSAHTVQYTINVAGVTAGAIATTA